VEVQNKSILQRIRIAQVEGKDWKEELQNYLFCYRTTPHSVLGISPAEALMGRKLRTKLPDLRPKAVLDEHLRDADNLKKMKGKDYKDEKRGAKPSNVEVGDKVLVQQSQKDKFASPFHVTPYKVIDKVGTQVIVESPQGVQYRRNVAHVKKYTERLSTTRNGESSDAKADTACNNGYDATTQELPPTTAESNSAAPLRPVRATTLPKKLSDYELAK
jgi:hypothetical protein